MRLRTVGLLASGMLVRHFSSGAEAHTTWNEYLGGADSAQYSALKQVNKSNVSKLEQVWFYPAGNNGFRFGFNPLVVDNLMFVLGKDNQLVGLDATTGKEVWVHDNNKPRSITHRGINYWESKDRTDRRLFYSTNNLLHAVDARTGHTIESFGNAGSVDLREGLGRDPKTIRAIQPSTPGRVFENLLILGSATGEEYGSPPGDLRAFDVITGKLVWTFHTVPHPDEFGYDTWPKGAWKYIGGTNTWGEISVDDKRGIAYFPIGSPTYDFYGADRPGTNLFSDCLLALDARTGKHLWHYQVVHHDLWDYDLTTAPKLLTVKHEGKSVDIVAQAGKNGFLYVFDRVTGKPLWPIEERPVPKSDMPGEEAWPTQPFPTVPPPFARQKFTADDIDPYINDPAERGKLKDEVLSARNEGLFTPPGLRNTVEMPGNNGGGNWGAAAVDGKAGMFYIESKDAPSMLKLEPKPPKRQMTGSKPTLGRIIYLQNCRTCHGEELQGQPPAVPSLVDAVSKVGVDRIRTAVTNGAPPMPAFTDLNSDELDSLLAYLKEPAAAHVPPDVLAFLTGPQPAPPRVAPGEKARDRYWTGYGYMNSSEGYPAIKPPWTTLTAYNLNEGTIKWRIPLGEVAAAVDRGIRDTGSFWPRGGPVVTAGGLIFVGTKSDNKIRAYDQDSGKVLWEKELPAGPEGIPAVFEVGGREYVAISARPAASTGFAEGRPPQRNAPGGANSPAERQQTQGYYVFALAGKK